MNQNPIETTQHKIKTFAYQSLNSFHKSYKSWLTNYRNKKEMRDFVKIGGLLSVFLFFFGLFLYYINLASTRGYYYKMASWELESTKAKNNIVKLDVIRKERENRDNLSAPRTLNLQKNLITIEISDLNDPEEKND